MALERLKLSELMLCDPSEKMLADAQQRVAAPNPAFRELSDQTEVNERRGQNRDIFDTLSNKLKNQACEFHCIGSEKLDFENRFDVVTAIQSHHYFERATRETAVKNCFKALKPGGIFICFENTAPFSETGKELMLKRLEDYEIQAGRTPEEVKSHSARYDREFFPITIKEHLELLEKTGFSAAELFWHSYMQSGFFAVKKI